jgi:tetratricopeptide (TPR) repeat protein
MNKIKRSIFLVFALFLGSCSTNGENETDNKIVFKDDKGNEISMSDLEGVTGSYNWELKDDTQIPEEANRLHQEARQYGGEGKYDLAIQKLEKAYEIAPNWAYPVYDLAYTYLLQKDFSNALKYYKMTDEMEPKGFFMAPVGHWSLKKEKAGEFHEGLYLAFMQIEWMSTSKEKLQTAKMIVDKFPTYAPAWEVIAQQASSNEERLGAVEKGLSFNPDISTKGMLLINKALVKNIQKKEEEAKDILGEVIFDKETTLGNIELAKSVLLTIVK